MWEVMQGIPAMPQPPKKRNYETKPNGTYGPVRCELRIQLESMKLGDELVTSGRTSAQVGAIAYHVRRVIPEAKYTCRRGEGWQTVIVTRIA